MAANVSFEQIVHVAGAARRAWRQAAARVRPAVAEALVAALLDLAEALLERGARADARAALDEAHAVLSRRPPALAARFDALAQRLAQTATAAASAAAPPRRAAVLPAAPAPAAPAGPKRGAKLPAGNAAAEAAQADVQVVWFGTNRRPLDPARPARAFGEERDERTHLGVCEVYVPRSHQFGSIGSGWFRRLITFTDDRLKLRAVRLAAAEADFWADLRAKLAAQPAGENQALVFIHGYNVSFEEAALRAGQIAEDLKPPGVTAFFSWPSKGSLAGYPADEATIEYSVPFIRDFLRQVARDSGAARVHVLAHSMGNRGLMRALEDLADDAALREGVPFGQIILAAPDIDAAVFRQVAAVYPRLAERTTLYVSPGDRALQSSKLLHQYPRAGFTPPVTVVPGIDTVEVPQLDLLDLGHGYFAEFAGVLHDIHELLRGNTPPARRLRPRPAGAHWRIAA
jgi:esterase/lipase superfamily enzyme